MTTIMSEREFDATYSPFIGPRKDEPLWDTSEFEAMKSKAQAGGYQVWTIVEGDDDNNWYAAPGYHIVNRIGYLLTKKPCADEGRCYVWFEDEEET